MYGHVTGGVRNSMKLGLAPVADIFERISVFSNIYLHLDTSGWCLIVTESMVLYPLYSVVSLKKADVPKSFFKLFYKTRMIQFENVV